jgi:hypothetical protein
MELEPASRDPANMFGLAQVCDSPDTAYIARIPPARRGDHHRQILGSFSEVLKFKVLKFKPVSSVLPSLSPNPMAPLKTQVSPRNQGEQALLFSGHAAPE